MDEYINREAFLATKRKVYCEDCDSRKISKGKMVYDIGDAPCRACGVGDVLDDVEDFPAADVVERKHGKWIGIPSKTVSKRNRTIHSMVYICPLCRYSNGRRKSNFCPNCGADMRGEDDGT